MTEINHLQKLQNRAAHIVTGSRFNAPGRPLIKKLGWKTIDELTDDCVKDGGEEFFTEMHCVL